MRHWMKWKGIVIVILFVMAACGGEPDVQEAIDSVEQAVTEAAPEIEEAATEVVEAIEETATEVAEEVEETEESTEEPEPTDEPEPTEEPAEPPEETAATQTDKIVIAYNGYEGNVTPFTHTFNSLPNTHNLVMLIYDSLFWSANDIEPEPWLAETAEPNDDFTQWTVTLRPDVTWHDGEPFTAEDVAFSFQYYKDSGLPGRYAHHTFDQPPFDRAEVIDDLTVELFFAAPVPAFKQIPGGDLPIIPQHIWSDIENPVTATEMLPVGTGPYMLVEIVPDELYRFEANNDYFMGQPLVAEIEMPIITAPPAAWAALQAGQVDFVAREVAPPLVAQISENEEFEILRGTHMTSINLFFNTRRPIPGDQAVRKALSMAIDKQALVDTILLGNGRPGRDSFVHPESPYAIPDGGHVYDPEAAAALLDEAGYSETDSEGIRLSPEGERLEIEVLVPSEAPLIQRTMQLAAEQVQPLGIQLNVVALDTATLRQRRQPALEFDYDAFVQPLESHTHADPDGLYYFFHSPGKGVGGIFSAYRNPDFDALAEQAAVTIDMNERQELLNQMQMIMAEDVPAIVLFYPDGIYAYRVAAYDGWVVEPGQGAFTKRSFLP